MSHFDIVLIYEWCLTVQQNFELEIWKSGEINVMKDVVINAKMNPPSTFRCHFHRSDLFSQIAQLLGCIKQMIFA